MVANRTNRETSSRFGPLVLLLTLLPALSRWWLSQLPAGADTAVHFYRAVELDWLIRNGIWYSRWLPDLVFGYGYPLFNYYGPLANYLIVAWHGLGLNFTAATLAAFACADVLGAFGAYLLARDTLGRLPGLVAAIAYAYSPYILASLYRGALPESLGLGLLPWLLWAFYRLWHTPSLKWLIVGAGLFALFPPTHNPSTALATVILVAFVCALYFANQSPHASRSTLHVLGALALGLGLSAFFWLPIPLELQYIDISKAYGPAVINYHNNFLALGQVFALPKPVDPNLIGGTVAYGVGLPQAILALLALVTLRRLTREQKMLLGLSALAIPVLIFLTLPQSVRVWENLPGLSLIQFPGRLLGPASLLLALLAGSLFVETPETPHRGVSTKTWMKVAMLSVSTLAIILFGFGWLYTAVDESIPAQPTVTDIQAYEHRTGVVGTTTAGEYLPKWVETRPPDESLQAQYAQGPVIQRLDAGSLPTDAQLLSQTLGLLSQKVQLDAPESFTARFNVFYFPGWTAVVDGTPVEVKPETGTGLVLVPVPAGQHTVFLQFTDTWPRTLGWLISGLALLVTVVLGVRGWFGVQKKVEVENGMSGGLERGPLVALAVVGLATLGIKLFYTDQPGSVILQKHFDGQTLQGVQHPLDISFGDQLQLLGYDTSKEAVTLYWRALQPLDTDWSVSVTADYAGYLAAQNDAQHPAGLPTSRWFTDQYAQDGHGLRPKPGTPPGDYDLRVTVYRQSDGVVLQPSAVKIGTWQVGRLSEPTLVTPPIPEDAHFGPIVLYGIDLPAEVRVGDELPVMLYWRATGSIAQDLMPNVELVSKAGDYHLRTTFAPVATGYGTSQWQTGDVWVGVAKMAVKADAPSGDYTFRIQTPDGWYELGKVNIIAPERRYTSPAISHQVNLRFTKVGALLGWDYGENKLTLYWQATETATTSYRVFVHVVNANGDILAQRDAVPEAGTRPTTSWLANEIITDSYDLSLPLNTTGIQVGLYDPATGERLQLANGSDSITLRP